MTAPDYKWVPGGFPPPITLTVKLTLMVIMLVRGMDYATGEAASTARRLGAVESAAPLWLWGALFAGAATVGFASMAWRWWSGVVAAHALGAALYAAVGVGLVIDVVSRGERPDHSPWWVFTIPIIALVATLVGGWRERRKRHSIPVIIAATVAIAIGLATMQLDGLRNATVLFGVAALHAALTIGTAQVAARARILRDMKEGEVWTL
ncbi:hypothetical protein [Corynebacterium qintianiae]|uniref:hypothetical protein n=1 Tax=Corynebacterium qintianiae TaxID=2709392 RepID=UPI0013EA0047|nr:hypothetical protein [Corynebacterium qintianiae]